MKREAVHHSKMKRLCRRLDLELWQAVGLMESIWHVTARQTPRGDIGRLPDDDIAIAIDYKADEHAMVEALVDCGWFDRSSQFRLVVHDWPDHAQDAVHMKLARGREFFVRTNKFGDTVLEMPRLSRLYARERDSISLFYQEQNIITKSIGVRTEVESVRTEVESVRTNGRSVHTTLPPPSHHPNHLHPETSINSNSATSSSSARDDVANLSFEQQICGLLGFERLSKTDRKFCDGLQDAGTSIEAIKAAIIVGKARRFVHEANTGTADRIGSLRYFAGTIEEATKGLLESGYVSYMESWLKRQEGKK